MTVLCLPTLDYSRRDNSLVSGVGELLFNSPDQRLAQSAETFLTAAQAYAADPGALASALDALSTSFHFDGAMVGLIPSADIGKVIEQVLDTSGYDAGGASAATDLASSAARTPDSVLGEATTVFNEGSAALATAPTVDLSTRATDILSGQEALPTQVDTSLNGLASLQDMLSAGDQTLVADVDERFVSAAQNLLTADHGFVAADQAGELGGNSLNAPELAIIGADLQVLGADFDVTGATILAALTGGLDVSSVTDLASTLDPAAAVDPSLVADLLSTIGL